MKKYVIIGVIIVFFGCFLVVFLNKKDSHKRVPVLTSIHKKNMQVAHHEPVAYGAKSSYKGSPHTRVEEPLKNEKSDKEQQYELNKEFEAEAMETFPLLSVDTYNPVEPAPYGPREGEIWIRIRPDHAKEYKDIMAQVADMFKEISTYNKPVTVMLWVGGRPWAKFTYPPPGQDTQKGSQVSQ